MEHQGEIIKADDASVVVRIGVGAQECAGCAIAGFCSRPTEVAVPSVPGAEVGRRVQLAAESAMRARAVWLLVAIPLALLVASLLIFSFLGLPQWVCGVAPLCAVALWYAAVGLTIGRRVNFRIAKIL